jgi:hypothetical protein
MKPARRELTELTRGGTVDVRERRDGGREDGGVVDEQNGTMSPS